MKNNNSAEQSKETISNQEIIDLTSDPETEITNANESSPKKSLQKSVKRKLDFSTKSKKKKRSKENSDGHGNNSISTMVNSKKFELINVSNNNLKLKCDKVKIEHFDISKEDDIARLETRQRQYIKNYSYNRNFNKEFIGKKLYIAPVYAIGEKSNLLGVYTSEEIKAGEEIIAYYAGTHCNDEDENEKSKAVFELTNRKGEITDIIDGEINGDWTAYINGGHNANLYVKQEVINNQIRICFRVGVDIAPHQQFIVEYGKDYKDKLGDHFRYLHPDDNWESPLDKFNNKKNHKFYAKGIYRFDQNTCENMLIDPSYNWIIPAIFHSIIRDDVGELTRLLEDGCTPDLLAYTCDSTHFLPTNHQYHLTALMLACYLAREKCIKILLEYGADPDRSMLVSGITPITLLLLSPASEDEVNKIGIFLLQHIYYPFTTDKNHFTLLHYAIKRNSIVIVSELLKIAFEDGHDIFAQMFEQQKKQILHADVDYCLIHDQLEMAKILLTSMLEKEILAKNFNSKLIFKAQTFLRLPTEKLEKLYSFFNENFNFQTQKIYLIEAIKKYLLILVGQKPYMPEKISPTQEIDFLWRFLTHAKNTENMELFLNNINPQYFFEKCISQRNGIKINKETSPLEFALHHHPDIAIQVLARMQNYLAYCTKDQCYKLLCEFDFYSCLCLSIEKSNFDVYDGIMSFYKNHDQESKLITLLLSRLIENFQTTPSYRQIFETVFNDSTKEYELKISGEQKTFLLLSLINLCSVQKHKIIENISTINFIMECICKNFPTIKQPDYNLPLITALENKLPIVIFYFFLKEGNINGCGPQGSTPLQVAVENESREQIQFLLNSGAKFSEGLCDYAEKNGCSEILQLLQNNKQNSLSRRYPFLTSLNRSQSPDNSGEEMIYIDKMMNC